MKFNKWKEKGYICISDEQNEFIGAGKTEDEAWLNLHENISEYILEENLVEPYLLKLEQLIRREKIMVMKGLQNYNKRMKEQDEQRDKQQSDFGMFLNLKAGDIASIRILSEMDKVGWGKFHGIADVSSSGKQFFRKVQCEREYDEEGIPTTPPSSCKYCSAGGQEGYAGDLFFLYVHVYYILHAEQNSDESNPWERVKRGENHYYKEQVNRIKVLRTGPGKGRGVVNKLTTYFNKYQTLCDRDYDWERTGTTKDNTIYELIADDPSKLEKYITDEFKKVPDISGIVSGEVTSLVPDEREDAPDVEKRETPKLTNKKEKKTSKKEEKVEEEAPVEESSNNEEEDLEGEDLF
jgi:hypothetical protein